MKSKKTPKKKNIPKQDKINLDNEIIIGLNTKKSEPKKVSKTKPKKKKKVINGKEYTRVADSEVISIRNQDLFMIYIDKSINCRMGDLIEDENGNQFTVEGIAIFEFTVPAPKWYYNMLYIEISGRETNSIGDYLIVCK